MSAERDPIEWAESPIACVLMALSEWLGWFTSLQMSADRNLGACTHVAPESYNDHAPERPLQSCSHIVPNNDNPDLMDWDFLMALKLADLWEHGNAVTLVWMLAPHQPKQWQPCFDGWEFLMATKLADLWEHGFVATLACLSVTLLQTFGCGDRMGSLMNMHAILWVTSSSEIFDASAYCLTHMCLQMNSCFAGNTSHWMIDWMIDQMTQLYLQVNAGTGPLSVLLGACGIVSLVVTELYLQVNAERSQIAVLMEACVIVST